MYVHMGFPFVCFTPETEVVALDKWLCLSRVVVVIKLRQFHSCNLSDTATMKCFQKTMSEQ